MDTEYIVIIFLLSLVILAIFTLISQNKKEIEETEEEWEDPNGRFVSDKEFKRILRDKYKTTRIVGEQYRAGGTQAQWRLNHKSFDGGELEMVYVSQMRK